MGIGGLPISPFSRNCNFDLFEGPENRIGKTEACWQKPSLFSSSSTKRTYTLKE